ncbi:hypothetical protein CVT26_004931 [Gymnopilus dilepis]|uniref:Uncharacterized protein n=1 Tax=Gymnopilus dilepis TaxID=231916 RepID=A0A409YJ27_9AGAR|nr:hypothetical protein CVT26_004931 [Gymnopilus dilepis]
MDFPKKIYRLLTSLHTLGIHCALAERLRYRAPTDHQFLESLASYHQWEENVGQLRPMWKMTCTLSALFLSLSDNVNIELFPDQSQLTRDGKALCRTSADCRHGAGEHSQNGHTPFVFIRDSRAHDEQYVRRPAFKVRQKCTNKKKMGRGEYSLIHALLDIILSERYCAIIRLRIPPTPESPSTFGYVSLCRSRRPSVTMILTDQRDGNSGGAIARDGGTQAEKSVAYVVLLVFQAFWIYKVVQLLRSA